LDDAEKERGEEREEERERRRTCGFSLLLLLPLSTLCSIVPYVSIGITQRKRSRKVRRFVFFSDFTLSFSLSFSPSLSFFLSLHRFPALAAYKQRPSFISNTVVLLKQRRSNASPSPLANDEPVVPAALFKA
jgi:hypothetical protein